MAYNFYPTGYQPNIYPQPNAQPQQTQSSMIWIQGEAAAKSYLVAPNSTVTLWDSESPTIYIKSTDAAGIPSMRIFDYKERTAKPKEETRTDYASLSDFEKLKSDVEEMKQYLKSQIESEKGKEKSK
jgi:hypothetical protein